MQMHVGDLLIIRRIKIQEYIAQKNIIQWSV